MEGEDRYIGKQIGNYRIVSALASGAFGRVYEGVHRYLAHRIVAIKIMHLTHLGSAEERESFLQEAEFLEMLKHKYILPIYDVGIDDEGFPYLVAEFAPNGSLRDRIKRTRPQLLPLEESLRILGEIGQGLQSVHEQNIVHRDLKPENILFNAKNEALLADFGIAVFLETTQTKYANVLGSPLYMAPEQFDGMASRRSDQYSLACIAYELVTGRPPFVSNHALTLGMKHQQEAPLPPTHFNPAVPEHVELAILRALAKRREERYPDIQSFITALLTVPTSLLPDKTNEQRLDEGYRLFNAGRYKGALAVFEHASQLDPTFADAYEGQGAALYSLGYQDEALSAYEQAIRLNPAYASAYNGKGNILYDLKRYSEALKAYEQALQLDPNFADAYVGKGGVLYYLGRYADAIGAYDRAIHLDPGSVAAYEGKGWGLWHAGHYQEALTPFEQALRLDTRNVSSYIGKGKAHYHLGHNTEALQCFEQAILLAPDDRSHEYKADALYRLKRYEEALAAYERSIELKSDVASSHEGRGWVLWQLKRYEEALAAYERAILLNPDAAFPYYGCGNVLYNLGRYNDALLSYDLAVQINPQLAAAYNGKGNVLADFKRYDDALASYEQAITLQPKVGAFHQNKADTLMQLGLTEEAQHEYALARQEGYS